jgi:sigma-B regulation protein RsbU (phosphoserine phosphatase)
MRYVNAGHNPPIVMRRDGSMEWLEEGGAPVGMFPAWKYQEGVLQLKSGDLLIAYTDGVIEAENLHGQLWRVEGLRKIAAQNRDRSADEIADAIFNAMDQFSTKGQTDDATVVVLRIGRAV